MANSQLQQTKTTVASASGQNNLAYGSTVTTGSLLRCWVAMSAAGSNVSVKDNINGNWTQAGSNIFNGGKGGAWWYFIGAAGGATTVEVTVLANTPNLSILIYEDNVGGGTVAFDHSITNTGAAGTDPSTGTVTVSGTGGIAAGAASWQTNAATGASGGGFVFDQSTGTGECGATATDYNASANEACTITGLAGVNSAWAAMAISFTVGGGGTTTNSHFLMFM